MSKKDKSAEGDAPPKKKSKKKLLFILVAVLLLGGGGAGGYLYFAGGGEPEPPQPGAVIALEPVTVNLADGHFLKVRIALQATADVAEEPDGSKALDILISQFSNKSVAELASNAAREEEKKKLKERIAEAYEHEIMDVYFTEFVMQ